MKIKDSELEKIFSGQFGQGSGLDGIKITDDELDRVFGRQRRQDTAALPVSAPKTEIKTDYSQPKSNYGRDQVASKLPAAQAQLQNMSRNKRYIINPINQTATAVNREQTIFGGLPGAFVESTLQGIGNAFSNMVNTSDTVKAYTAMPGKVYSDLQNVMYEPFKAENQRRVKEIVERNQQQYGLDSEYVAQIQEGIKQRNIKQAEKLEKIREKYKDVKGADVAITAGTGIGNMVPSMVVGATTGAPVIGTSVFSTNVFGGAMGEGEAVRVRVRRPARGRPFDKGVGGEHERPPKHLLFGDRALLLHQEYGHGVQLVRRQRGGNDRRHRLHRGAHRRARGALFHRL